MTNLEIIKDIKRILGPQCKGHFNDRLKNGMRSIKFYGNKYYTPEMLREIYAVSPRIKSMKFSNDMDLWEFNKHVEKDCCGCCGCYFHGIRIYVK
jgi:hypothetical protein